jgi:hypothetical protein
MEQIMNICFADTRIPIMARIEIHLFAEQLVRRHGRGAWAEAAAGAEACAAMGDWEQVGHWRQIGRVVRSLERRNAFLSQHRRALSAMFSSPCHAMLSGENAAFG